MLTASASRKMMPVLELIRDDVLFTDALQIVRQADQWTFGLHDGVHRFYASRTLGFTHVPAEAEQGEWLRQVVSGFFEYHAVPVCEPGVGGRLACCYC